MPIASPVAAFAGSRPPRPTVTRAVGPLSSRVTRRRSAYDGVPSPLSPLLSVTVATGLYGGAGDAPAAWGADVAAGALIAPGAADPPAVGPADASAEASGVAVSGDDCAATGPADAGRPARSRRGVSLVSG